MARERGRQNPRGDSGAGLSGEASNFGIGKEGSQPSPERAHLAPAYPEKHCSKRKAAIERERISTRAMAESPAKEKTEHGQMPREAAPPADKTLVMSSAELNTALPQIPDHKLLRCIGRGAYGEVWLGRSVTGTYRAIKVIWRKSFETSRPFEREFAGIQKFEPISRSHAGLVNILHVGRNDDAGYFYYVMELADNAQTGAETD